ncbi:MAG TPA: DUF4870 domain-containing protein, partial [Rectinemataceae bacterium]|nr:DUF4870 domain-containing protein [Rectinemataceae bacterium]
MSAPADETPYGGGGSPAGGPSETGGAELRPSGLVLPRPDEVPQRDRDDAMGAYLMMFASWAVGLPFPFLNLIASWVYYLVNRRGSRFVAFNSYQALLSHLPVAFYNALIVVWLLVALFGGHTLSSNFLPAAIIAAVLNLAYVVFSVIALRRATKGIFYYIPWFGRIAFGHFYGPRALARE